MTLGNEFVRLLLKHLLRRRSLRNGSGEEDNSNREIPDYIANSSATANPCSLQCDSLLYGLDAGGAVESLLGQEFASRANREYGLNHITVVSLMFRVLGLSRFR